MIQLEYIDQNGIHRRVKVSNRGDNPQIGIPVDVYDLIDEMYTDMPDKLRVELCKQLWNRNLIESKDFHHPTAGKRVRESLIATYNLSAVNLIMYIKENN